MEHVDAVVVGAGFGGLGAALQLAECGRRVVVCEALTYAGGCAGTFARQGLRFDAGATMAMGVEPSEALHTMLARHGVTVPIQPLEPVVEVRTPHLRHAVGRGPNALRASLAALAPHGDVEGFTRMVAATAGALRPLLRDANLLPPLGVRALWRHTARLPAYLPLLGLVGRPLATVLRRYGLDTGPVRQLLEPLCWVTVQVGVDEAEAPFALAALDAMTTGACHVVGGMGALADGLVEAVRRAGGEVRFAHRVKAIAPADGGWEVHTRHGVLQAPQVFANVLPQGLHHLLRSRPAQRARASPAERGPPKGGTPGGGDTLWGAAMLYLSVDGRHLPPEAAHLDLCTDPEAPYLDGNHVFVSVGAADDAHGPPGQRAVVASCHVPMRTGTLPCASRVHQIQERMREALRGLAPEVVRDVRTELVASPRTFQRFTRRAQGWVGGVPRRAGLGAYLGLWPRPVARGLHLVGDSTLLGQSTLATALSGARIAAAALGVPATVTAPPGPALVDRGDVVVDHGAAAQG